MDNLMGLDVMSIVETITGSPYGLTVFLLLFVFWLKRDQQINTIHNQELIRQQNKYIQKIIQEEKNKAEEREKWFQDFFDRLVEVFDHNMDDIRKDIKSMNVGIKRGRDMIDKQKDHYKQLDPTPDHDDSIDHDGNQ